MRIRDLPCLTLIFVFVALLVPVLGLCLYPLVDRPDWNDASHWHHSGLWDHAGDLESPRLVTDYAAALARWQARLGDELACESGTAPAPLLHHDFRRWRA